MDDMLCLGAKGAQMPVKSRKIPFAFLKKSDYNDTQTVFDLHKENAQGRASE